MQFPNRTNRTLLSSRGQILNTACISGVSWMKHVYFIGVSIILNNPFEAVAPMSVPLERTTFPASNLNQLAYA